MDGISLSIAAGLFDKSSTIAYRPSHHRMKSTLRQRSLQNGADFDSVGSTGFEQTGQVIGWITDGYSAFFLLAGVVFFFEVIEVHIRIIKITLSICLKIF